MVSQVEERVASGWLFAFATEVRETRPGSERDERDEPFSEAESVGSVQLKNAGL